MLRRSIRTKSEPIRFIDEQQKYFQGKRRELNFPIPMKGKDLQIKKWKLLSRITYAN